MKRFLVLLIVAGLLGCSYGKERIEVMLEHPGVLEDPLYTEFQQELDKLEGRYLRKEISYAEYVRQKQELEDKYTGVAEKRKRIIEGY